MVNAIFTSRLDYCNSLMAGLTVQDFTRLQILQNGAARCVLMRPRDFSATDMLCELHWLPVCKRVFINCCYSLTKLLIVQAPEYLVPSVALAKRVWRTFHPSLQAMLWTERQFSSHPPHEWELTDRETDGTDRSSRTLPPCNRLGPNPGYICLSTD